MVNYDEEQTTTTCPHRAIEKANRKSDDEFMRDYLSVNGGHGAWNPQWQHPLSQESFRLNLVRSESLSESDLIACLDLIELTSGQDYKNSTVGWHRSKKLKEMKSADMRYILVRDCSGSETEAGGAIVAFTSFMPTYEEGQPVIYCYEIHLHENVRRGRLGKLLLGYLCNVAASMPPVQKVMLTCFVANSGGLAFYDSIGFVKDEISPEPRRLRKGQAPDPEYVILSKVVGRRLCSSSKRG